MSKHYGFGGNIILQLSTMSDDEYEGPGIPHGTNQTRKRGWGGGDMEMEHQQESSRKGKRQNVAAVNVRQFQNTIVGEGYQAKHVIRQPGQQADAAKLVDMTGGSNNREDSKKEKVKSSFNRNNYIECKGLREFRKEIEKILANP
eukprot:scaffold3736_cov103-Cylindrotheca_fusiformis.AAC.1